MVITTNQRAYFDYRILETLEAGIELKGFEVKAIKSGRINLAGSSVIINQNQAWLVNADIAPYQPANTPPNYNQKRDRRLLLQKEEIKKLIGKINGPLTLVPLKIYTKKSRIKIEIGLAQRKRKVDKREAIREKEEKKSIKSEIEN